MTPKEEDELRLTMNDAFKRWINVGRMLRNHPKITCRPEMLSHLPSLAVPDEGTMSALWKVAIKRFNNKPLDESDQILVDNIWTFVRTATELHKQLNEELAGNRKQAPTYTDFQNFMKENK